MILFTPYFPGLTDYDQLAAELKKKGSLQNHVHRVISRVRDEEAAFAFGQSLADLFHESSYAAMRDNPKTGYQLSNEMFMAAAEFVATYQPGKGEMPNTALLYMDPEYRPLRNQWLDSIQSQYYLAHAPRVFGRPAKATGTDPTPLVGPVVISREFLANTPLLGFVPPDTHWRTYCHWEIAKSFAETDLIGPGPEAVLQHPKHKR